jgi:hypothetical protein
MPGLCFHTLFTDLPGESVWIFGMYPESGLRKQPRGSKESRAAVSWRQRSALGTPSVISQAPVLCGRLFHVRTKRELRF